MVTAAVKRICFMLLLLLVIRSAEAQQKVYNVLDFHAAGDGKTDDAQVFLATWQAACSDRSGPIMAVPGGRTFLLGQVQFQGPCKSPITVQLDGNIVAPNAIWTSKAGSLLTFFNVDNLTVDGNGEIDGQGAIWWDCYNRKNCGRRPVLLAFARCKGLTVRRIHLKDSADKHMTLFQCSQVKVDGVSVTAPADSPNTDGITMAKSNYVSISKCSMQTGDDCVSILSDTTDVDITYTTCGPGHGISVGSLGRSEAAAMVERITVSHCNFVGSMTGVRIKSWQGGKGYAKGFLFENLNMTEVQNPIIIDQFYCPQGNCPKKDGGVAISDARFINIQGTSSRKEAVRLLCSQSVHCQDIYLRDINLSWVKRTAEASATILNAHGTTEGTVVPRIQFSENL